MPHRTEPARAKIFTPAEWAAAYPPLLREEAAPDAILHPLARFLQDGEAAPVRIVGIAGGVASGKSTFAKALMQALMQSQGSPRVEIVSTDGFLFPNGVLGERGLTLRKGFPESYDIDALRAAVAEMRRGREVSVPLYSHVTYDIERIYRQIVRAPDFVILDGLHLARIDDGGAPLLDRLIYLDAEEAAIETWFKNRLLPLMEAGRNDPNSFYHAFREMNGDEARDFADRVWHGINLPNLRDHITADREAADIVLHKTPDHTVRAVTVRA
jgi:type I pantothenate kinase